MKTQGIVLFVVALAATLVVATVVSQIGSDEPDGLEYVAEQEGFADAAEDHTLGEAPLADYGANTDGGDAVGLAASGLVGVLVTLVIGAGLFWLLRADKPGRGETAEP